MKGNFYIKNRQKLLFMAQEIHKRGFGKLRIIPSVSPSGMYWRCNFVDEAKRNSFIASNWLLNYEKEDSEQEIELTAQELADLFMKENIKFIDHCKGRNQAYEKWYANMLEQLTADELPYAFADWEIPENTWQTSKGNEIKTLPNEHNHY
ncbi:hypothetical protein IA57_02590 [Mangrovimonas yunxiaonensis]|uniref:Uncharacterized protein n=1 Tax=Mangrovimonas yunxiaonensis TaxID=1197477 RepID=A0A084TM46_9FLAO|nr:hypothetical protein [Mangrovimonas yunxiaonensis]KFB01782.1 hypothetical protein IA57_02590 [Mangrovimonas yunxiaonensis]GGH40938.1 hypothetical protein GCM10011364_11440 [Mangrovimonas yunxiaonensis]